MTEWMRAKYLQPDGRAVGRRKWSALKTGGPLVYFCELLLKLLIKHGFACEYRIIGNRDDWAEFTNAGGDTDLFRRIFRLSLQVIERKCRCVVTKDHVPRISLIGEWVLRLRFAGGKPVAATFVKVDSASQPLVERRDLPGSTVG